MARARKTSASTSPVRLTLYVRPEQQELLHWAQEHTQARSLSESVFAALAELKALVREKRLQALEQAHGIWKDDTRIEEAFRELEEGWDKWRRQVEGH